MNKEEKQRGQYWQGVFYNESQSDVIDYIKSNYQYASIVHDKDTLVDTETGEITTKKPHTHIVFFTGKNFRYKSAIAKELEVQENYFDKCTNVDSCLAYLIHFYNKDKYQYSIDEVDGQLKTRLTETLNSEGKSEGQKVIEIIDYIEGQEYIVKISNVARWCATNGLWSEYRRAGSIINGIIYEHNESLRSN